MKEIPNKFLVSLSLFSLFFAMPTQAAAEDLPTQAVPEVQILDVAADETVQLDGLRVRWTSVTYELSTGHEAEMFVEVDDHGRGDAYILLEGEELMHVATDEHGGTTRCQHRSRTRLLCHARLHTVWHCGHGAWGDWSGHR
jgi:hypothetical protein